MQILELIISSIFFSSFVQIEGHQVGPKDSWSQNFSFSALMSSLKSFLTAIYSGGGYGARQTDFLLLT
jgi:hypothetical protein